MYLYIETCVHPTHIWRQSLKAKRIIWENGEYMRRVEGNEERW